MLKVTLTELYLALRSPTISQVLFTHHHARQGRATWGRHFILAVSSKVSFLGLVSWRGHSFFHSRVSTYYVSSTVLDFGDAKSRKAWSLLVQEEQVFRSSYPTVSEMLPNRNRGTNANCMCDFYFLVAPRKSKKKQLK